MEDGAEDERERFQSPVCFEPDAGNAPGPTAGSFTTATAGSPAPASTAGDTRALNGAVEEQDCQPFNNEVRFHSRVARKVVRWLCKITVKGTTAACLSDKRIDGRQPTAPTKRQMTPRRPDHFRLRVRLHSRQREEAMEMAMETALLRRRRPWAGGDEGGAPKSRRRLVARPAAELSTWNQEQLRLLKLAERRRWASLVMMSIEAQQGELASGAAAAHLEEAAEAFSFMIFRYRGYLPLPLRRKFMKHRQAVNAFAEIRRGTVPPESLLEFCGAVPDDEPFGEHEERYANTADANDPPNAGRWSWTSHNVIENPDT